MSDAWPITEEGTLMIKQNAIFDFKQIYKLVHTFAGENNYEFFETNFTRKDKGDGSEYQIEYELRRKVTEFIKFIINIEIWALRVVEVKQDNKMMFKGELEMNFDASMEMDWQNNWEKNSFTRFLRNVYIYYLKKQYFLNYAGKFWEEIYELHARVKGLLNQFSLF